MELVDFDRERRNFQNNFDRDCNGQGKSRKVMKKLASLKKFFESF